MRKVRVLKATPYFKVGDILNDSVFWPYEDFLNNLIKNGWLEWVEEDKSLEEEFSDTAKKSRNFYMNSDLWHSLFAKIAKEHYQKKFDEVCRNWEPNDWDIKQYVRKSMFGDKI